MPNHHRGPAAERRVLDAYVKLSRALATVDATVHRPLARAGLTVSRFGALEALWHLGPLNQRDLGRKILKSSGNVSVVVDGLERDGLVARERDPADRRNVIVSLSEAGRARIEAVYPAHVGRLVGAFGHLSIDDVERLAELAKALGTGVTTAPHTPLEEPS